MMESVGRGRHQGGVIARKHDGEIRNHTKISSEEKKSKRRKKRTLSRDKRPSHLYDHRPRLITGTTVEHCYGNRNWQVRGLG